MEDLFLPFKGKFENLYLAGIDNIKPICLVTFLEDELTFIKGQLKGDGLKIFQLGIRKSGKKRYGF